MEIAARSQDWTLLRDREYDFADPRSLDRYWSDKAVCMMLAGVIRYEEESDSDASSAENSLVRVSCVRSTASWEAN